MIDISVDPMHVKPESLEGRAARSKIQKEIESEPQLWREGKV
jgi:hypothetical protein